MDTSCIRTSAKDIRAGNTGPAETVKRGDSSTARRKSVGRNSFRFAGFNGMNSVLLSALAERAAMALPYRHAN
jgi:hypothetical protein